MSAEQAHLRFEQLARLLASGCPANVPVVLRRSARDVADARASSPSAAATSLARARVNARNHEIARERVERRRAVAMASRGAMSTASKPGNARDPRERILLRKKHRIRPYSESPFARVARDARHVCSATFRPTFRPVARAARRGSSPAARAKRATTTAAALAASAGKSPVRSMASSHSRDLIETHQAIADQSVARPAREPGARGRRARLSAQCSASAIAANSTMPAPPLSV